MINTLARPIRQPDPPNVILLHASAIRLDNGALIFMGRSGTGKSTICELLGEVGAKLADDMVYLVRQPEDTWIVADAKERASKGPLSTDEACAMQGVPLRALFELHQASEVRMQRISTVKACDYLARAYFDLHYWACHYTAETKRTSFTHLATMARSVPGYDLFFTLARQTPRTIRDELERQERFVINIGDLHTEEKEQ